LLIISAQAGIQLLFFGQIAAIWMKDWILACAEMTSKKFQNGKS
jgi:hypothetical protein